MKRNRYRYILNVSEYDLLVKIQKAMQEGYCYCVIEAITGKEYPCADNKVCMISTCEACIAKWLNKEG